MTAPRIAVLSLACRFPEANDTQALWQNVLDGRRSFRPIPDSRLALGDYDAARVGEADSIPRIPAALLTDWNFSRADFQVPKATYATADLTHWLALDVAAQAIGDVGGADSLKRERTAVIIGNTLTGEFTRSAQLRLRRPYLGRKLDAVLESHGVSRSDADEVVATFLATLSQDFPDPNEESLAGALANTIAGRIANYFDFHGGAWTVDGACASSLLAVADGCGRLMNGDVDVAIVGGVDLSLDPFELVGFARAGALATEDMRVFDRRAAGFWPGEGCGMAVLATEDAASRLGGTPLGWVRGWGVSTDGSGGLTRPTVDGQSRALSQAWRRAGLDPANAGFFEAHGTGTAVGDPTEIKGLATLAGDGSRAIPVGSIKGNIGHCKAAAGMAGLIKTACGLQHGIVPPHVGCTDPHPVFAETANRLTPAQGGALGSANHAGVSGFGFGGVNAHVVLEGPAQRKAARHRPVLPQDGELFLFSAETPADLRDDLLALRDRAASLSFGEMTDAAAAAASNANPDHPCKAAVVAQRSGDLVTALDAALSNLGDAPPAAKKPPRIGFLFPGQAAPVRSSGGAWGTRFPQDRDLFDPLESTPIEGETATQSAQPAIAASSLLGLRVLERFGLRAEAAVGHSMGELCALSWAGTFDAATCLKLATARGRAMAEHGVKHGKMARVQLGVEAAENMAERYGLFVACLNGARETVLAGRDAAIERLIAEQDAEELRVSHAFHSPDMAPAATAFADILNKTPIESINRPVFSTVIGAWLADDTDLRGVLLEQLTKPVRYTEAVAALVERVDLLLEVGPGAGLTRLATEAGTHCLPIDACAPTLRPLLQTLAELWRRGVPIDIAPLFADRPTRALSDTPPDMLSNPCGVPDHQAMRAAPMIKPPANPDPAPKTSVANETTTDVLEIVRDAVADELGLPVASVAGDSLLLGDLHLNSLSAGRIVASAAARLGMASPAAVMDLSNASSIDIATHLSELRDFGRADPVEDHRIEGVAAWIAEFQTKWEPAEAPTPDSDAPHWQSFGDDLPPDARHISLAQAGTGALIVLAASAQDANRCDIALKLWKQVKAARADGIQHIAIVHNGAGIAGFACSLIADGVFSSATLIDMDGYHDGWADVGRLLKRTPKGFANFRIARDGLFRPVLAQIPGHSSDVSPPSSDDVALVIGGARGLGAECALRLATEHGVALALVGRSAADTPAVRNTITRAKALGVRVAYQSADVTSVDGMRAALDGFAAAGLDPTIVLHAAGVNDPAGFDSISTQDVRAAFAPKLDGLDSLLCALNPDHLKLVVGFGSIIGALGLAGETHYALANGMMSQRLADWGQTSGVRSLALDWSIWAGAGMGERLGVIERLQQDGVDAIPLETALDRFDALVCDPTATGRRIVTARFGPPQHVHFLAPDLPPLRFIETPMVHFPGIELVADATLSPGTDPWLEDHVVDGTPVVPGVMLLEAAAQATTALTGQPPCGFEDVRFERAVALSGTNLTLRTAALYDGDGCVRVVLRASDDGFSADRASMTLLTRTTDPLAPPPEPVPPAGHWPAGALYGSLFFNAGRFQRIEALEAVSALSARVLLDEPKAGHENVGWFGPYLPQDLILGDPGARDAGLHALQVCAPQRRVLPVSVSKIALHGNRGASVVAEAHEIWSDKDRFCFDILWRDDKGRINEIWREAVFHAVSDRALDDLPFWALPAALERAAITVSGRRDIRVAVDASGPRDERRARALDRLGIPSVQHRGDGAPETSKGGDRVSLSHGGDWVLAASGKDAIGVDLVAIGAPCAAALRPADRLLETEIAALPGWNSTAASAAIWAAREALRKIGAQFDGHLKREPAPNIGGILLRCKGIRVICIGCGTDGCAALAVPINITASEQARAADGQRAAGLSTTV